MRNKIITAMLAAALAFGTFAAPAYAYLENDVNADETTETAQDESADVESDTEESADTDDTAADEDDSETEETETESTDTETSDTDTEESSGRNIWPLVLLLLVLGGIGGYFAYSRLKDRKKEANQTDPDDEYITDDDDDADDYLDDEYEEDAGDGSDEEPVCPCRNRPLKAICTVKQGHLNGGQGHRQSGLVRAAGWTYFSV